LKIYSVGELLMGNQFHIGAVSSNEELANCALNEAVQEIKRIEEKLSTYKEHSETNLINNNAGITPVEVSEETIGLIERAIKISDLTQGAFDITYGGLDKKFWNFDKEMKELPNIEDAQKAVSLINYRNIEIDKKESIVFLKQKGMRIGFGGIGKGYAADAAKKVMISMGIDSGVVNASGDMTVWGLKPKGEKWSIGIVHPSYQNAFFSKMEITNHSVATSGNYEKYVMIGGKRYSHTIDPKTGMPIKGVKSITTICPYAEFADAIATPIMVMGIEKGLNLVNQINGLECIIFDDEDKIYVSNNINIKK
jgi:FAD:protein FMN transferase